MIGAPTSREQQRKAYDFIRRQAMDAETQDMEFPAEYMFKGVPHYDRVDDPLDMLVSLMDHFGITKAPTGIDGLDEITEGGLPLGRPTLVCGSAGCGKTLMAIEFLVRGVQEFDEPGVLMTFEETADELAANVASLGFNLQQMQADKKLRLDHVHIDVAEGA